MSDLSEVTSAGRSVVPGAAVVATTTADPAWEDAPLAPVEVATEDETAPPADGAAPPVVDAGEGDEG